MLERRKLGVLAAGLLGLAHSRPWPAADIVVGQVVPLSGPVARTGAQVALGGRVYFDYINSTGGVNGQMIRHVVLDDGHRVEETVRLTRELVSRSDVVALFGFGGTSNIARLLADGVLQQGGAPLVAPYSGGDVLRSPYNPWIFHLRAGYADEAERIVHQEVSHGRRRFALMCQADGFGRAGLEALQGALARRNLQAVAAASFERTTEHVEHAVQRLVAAEAEVVVMFSLNRSSAAFARAYRAAGGKGALYNVSVVDAAELVSLAGLAAVQGMGITQVVPSPQCLSLPAVREFHKLMRRFAPHDSVNYANFEQFLGAKLLVEGLRRAGPRPARADLVAALESIDWFDLGGIMVSYSPDNRVGSRFVEITSIGSQGRLVTRA